MAELLNKEIKLSGGREQVTAEMAEKLLAECPIRDPVSVRLSNKSFSADAASVVASFLDSLDTTIRVADISDIIASRPEEEALNVLRIICESLKRFDLLEVNLSDNALGAKGIDACKGVLQARNMERLFVCNNGLSAEAAALLADILLAEGTAPPLRLFHFYNNMSGDNGAKAVAKLLGSLEGLQDLRFSATRASSVGCTDFAQAVGRLSNLSRLDLSDNTFGTKATGLLAQSLKQLGKLEHLNLRDDGLAVKTFVSTLSDARFPMLQFLDLSGNDIGTTECVALASWINAAAPELRVLLLDDNEIESDGARALAKATRAMKSLKHLSCCACGIQGSAAAFLAKRVSKLSSFDKLDLNGNAIGATALSTIRSLMAKHGKHLGDLDDNDEDGDEEEEEEEEEEESEEEEEGGVADQAEESVDALADELAHAQIDA